MIFLLNDNNSAMSMKPLTSKITVTLNFSRIVQLHYKHIAAIVMYVFPVLDLNVL